MADGDGDGYFWSERRLCILITRSFRLDVSDTDHSERNLLITLSSVSREIQRWTQEIDLDSDSHHVDDKSAGLDDGLTYCSNSLLHDSHVCLNCIVSFLVDFLAVQSPYVRHLVGNIIVDIFKFLEATESRWVEFIQLLWTALQESMSLLVLQLHSLHPSPVHKCLKINLGTLSEPKSQSLIFHTPINLIQAFHLISKYIKLDNADIMEAYSCLAIHSLSKLPWDKLSSSIQKGQMFGLEIESNNGGLVNEDFRSSGLLYILFGSILQLLCSLVDQNDLEEGSSGLDNSNIYFKFTSLVSNLLFCCFSHKECNHVDISRYLKHKSLMLMIRLSCLSLWKGSCVLLWLKLLRDHFEDLLYQPILKCHDKHSTSLEGSPFQVIVIGREHIDALCTCHLQRQVNLLFLKCCFQLVRLNNESVQIEISSTSEMQNDKIQCCTKGLSELYEWFENHVSVVSLEKYDTHLDGGGVSIPHSEFALKFLQLYMDEDDLLFEILLQWLDVPFSSIQKQNIGNSISSEMMYRDTMFKITNTFNPILLFHLFLLLLHYDHSVLLDYLISKDMGIQCVRYLLRCLRLVCGSWQIFVKCLCISQLLYTKTTKDNGNANLNLNDKLTWGLKRNKVGEKRKVIVRSSFEDAKECLFCLKTSIEDLHEKSLFPYNPSALLRSLSRFQELCNQHEASG